MRVACACGQQYDLKDSMAGRRVKCAACGSTFSVPGPQSGPLPLAADDFAPTAQQYADVTGTAASNAGKMRPDLLQIIRCYPLKHGTLLGVVAWSLLAGLVIHFSGFIVAAVFFGFWVMAVFDDQRAMANGDTNPGLVLKGHPCLVATFANMSTGRGSAPAIDIRLHPANRAGKGALEPGTHLAMLCQYGGRPDDVAWINLMPRPVICLTRNGNDVARTLASIPQRDWDSLEHYLGQISDWKPGQYRMWQGGRRVGNGMGVLTSLVLIFVACIAVIIPLAWGAKNAAIRPAHTPSANVPIPQRPPTPPPSFAPRSSVTSPRPAAPEMPKSVRDRLDAMKAAREKVRQAASRPIADGTTAGPAIAEPSPAPSAAPVNTQVTPPADALPAKKWEVGQKALITREGAQIGVTVMKVEGRRCLVHPDQGTVPAPATPTETWVSRTELAAEDGAPRSTWSPGDKAVWTQNGATSQVTIVKTEGRRCLIRSDGASAGDFWVSRTELTDPK